MGRWTRRAGLVLLAAAAAGCGDDPARVTPPQDPPPELCAGAYCDPAGLGARGYHPFYRKLLVASGDIPVISSARVADRALEQAATIVDSMLSARSDLRAALVSGGAYVGVMDDTEVTTDIPEHAHLANDPTVNWDTRARGLGGTPGRPITTVGEENLLCADGDVYGGESILVHEFAHTIHLVGIVAIEPAFDAELDSLYRLATREGRWAGTYAGTNALEYWAEGVQSWFDANQRPQPGVHNEVDTRTELAEHDPALHALIGRWFRYDAWRPTCPG